MEFMPLYIKHFVSTLPFFKEKNLEEIGFPLPAVVSLFCLFVFVCFYFPLLLFCRGTLLGFGADFLNQWEGSCWRWWTLDECILSRVWTSLKSRGKIPSIHSWAILISDVFSISMRMKNVAGGPPHFSIFLLCQARCDVVDPGAWSDSLLPPWKFSTGNLQAVLGCLVLPGRCKLGRSCPARAPSHLLGLAWETSLRRAARRSAAGQGSSCCPVCFIFKCHRSLSGMKQCCMSAPMQTSLHSFYLTGEIKIIPDINQLCSASEHNLNTFSWLLSAHLKAASSLSGLHTPVLENG